MDEETPYWFVGAYYKGSDGNQTDRFLRDGTWVNGYTDRYIDLVNSMEPGQRIAIKATHTQRNPDGLSFDNRGNVVSVMPIKATGTITGNEGDGRHLTVDWDPVVPERRWFFYTYQGTVWRVLPRNWKSRALIDFAFNGVDQPIDDFRNDPYWASRFGDNPPTDSASDSDQTRRAALIWPLLVECAAMHETIVFGKLAERAGDTFHQPAPDLLDMVEDFCAEHDLPPLAAIVVYSGTGDPLRHGGLEGDDLKAAIEDVFAYPWDEFGTPFANETPSAVAEQAARAWPHLVELAQTEPARMMNYKEMGAEIGAIAINVGHILRPIQEFCRVQGLPPITGLVVNVRKRKQGDGFTTGYDGWESDVRAFRWMDIDQPTAELLARYVPNNGSRNGGANRSRSGARTGQDHDVDMERLIASEADRMEKWGSFDPNDAGDAREFIAGSIARRGGQPKFRDGLRNAYSNACVITGCDVVEVLEAAHIAPYLGEKSNPLTNGLLLRADIHTLFDRGLIRLVVGEDGVQVSVADALKDSEYGELDGRLLRAPTHESFAPDPAAIEKRNDI